MSLSSAFQAVGNDPGIITWRIEVSWAGRGGCRPPTLSLLLVIPQQGEATLSLTPPRGTGPAGEVEEMLFTLGSRAPSKNKLALYATVCTPSKCPGEMGGARATRRAPRLLAALLRTMGPVFHGALWLLQSRGRCGYSIDRGAHPFSYPGVSPLADLERHWSVAGNRPGPESLTSPLCSEPSEGRLRQTQRRCPPHDRPQEGSQLPSKLLRARPLPLF